MENCLVTKLKSVVDNDNLEILNLMKIRLENFANQSITIRSTDYYFDTDVITGGGEIAANTEMHGAITTSIKPNASGKATLYSKNYGLDVLNVERILIDINDLGKVLEKLPYLSTITMLLVGDTIQGGTITVNSRCFKDIMIMGDCYMNGDTAVRNTAYNVVGDPVDVTFSNQSVDNFTLFISPKVRVNLTNCQANKIIRQNFIAFCVGNIANLPWAENYQIDHIEDNVLTGDIANLVANWRGFGSVGVKLLPAGVIKQTQVTVNGTPLQDYLTAQGLPTNTALNLSWTASSFSLVLP